jgi:hypothetical protein
MKTIKTVKLVALLLVTSIAFVSCSDDHDDDHDHEEDLITTVTYTLRNGNEEVTLEFKDLDGEGGSDGTYNISGPLATNTTYTVAVKILNETESPAEDITEEVKAEDDEHEFFYTTSISGLTIEKTDTDGNNNPLGIETSVTTTAAGSGTLTIVLKHEPTKPNNGTATNAGGSTDVEITFSVTIE